MFVEQYSLFFLCTFKNGHLYEYGVLVWQRNPADECENMPNPRASCQRSWFLRNANMCLFLGTCGLGWLAYCFGVDGGERQSQHWRQGPTHRWLLFPCRLLGVCWQKRKSINALHLCGSCSETAAPITTTKVQWRWGRSILFVFAVRGVWCRHWVGGFVSFNINHKINNRKVTAPVFPTSFSIVVRVASSSASDMDMEMDMAMAMDGVWALQRQRRRPTECPSESNSSEIQLFLQISRKVDLPLWTLAIERRNLAHNTLLGWPSSGKHISASLSWECAMPRLNRTSFIRVNKGGQHHLWFIKLFTIHGLYGFTWRGFEAPTGQLISKTAINQLHLLASCKKYNL